MYAVESLTLAGRDENYFWRGRFGYADATTNINKANGARVTARL